MIDLVNVPNQTTFIVHIDQKSTIDDFRLSCKNVEFVDRRIDVSWGTFSVVEATIELLRHLESKSFNEKDRFILLSGADLPLWRKEEILTWLNNYPDEIFIAYDAFPIARLAGGGADRVNNQWVNLSGRKALIPIAPYKINRQNVFGFFQLLKHEPSKLHKFFSLFLKPIKDPRVQEYYFGEMWWSAPVRLVRPLISFLNQNKWYINRFRYFKVPDESFFQTLFMLPEFQKILSQNRFKLENQCLTFVEWSDYRWPRPTTFIPEDFWSLLPARKTRQFLFARKFNLNSETMLENYRATLLNETSH